MEKLKSALADKIIAVSESAGENAKSTFDKINRFRDFAEACKSLMEKYPLIEPELVRMVEHNDFDTKVAASRVDTIIRLSENAVIPADNKNQEEEREENILPETEEQDVIIEMEDMDSDKVDFDPEIIYTEYYPADTDYTEDEVVEDIEDEVETEEELPEEETENNEPAEIIQIDDLKNQNIKKGLQIAGIILAIILLIFLVVFIIKNWKIVLYVTGGIVIVAAIGWLIYTNKKSNV